MSDCLSRLPNPIGEEAGEEESQYLSEKESTFFINHLMIPGDLMLPVDFVIKILDEESVKVQLPPIKARKRTRWKVISAKSSSTTLKEPEKVKDF